MYPCTKKNIPFPTESRYVVPGSGQCGRRHASLNERVLPSILYVGWLVVLPGLLSLTVLDMKIFVAKKIGHVLDRNSCLHILLALRPDDHVIYKVFCFYLFRNASLCFCCTFILVLPDFFATAKQWLTWAKMKNQLLSFICSFF